jgi:diguanylate cyclase (GGDEF)-like protein/PAS domain S-box-containing protein
MLLIWVSWIVSFICFTCCVWFGYRLVELTNKNQHLRKKLANLAVETSSIESSQQTANLVSTDSFHLKYYEGITTIAELGISSVNLDLFLQETTRIIAATLAVEFSQILELLPNNSAFVLKAGYGWQEHLIGFARINRFNNEAGFCTAQKKPIIMEDLFIEKRFQVSALLHNNKILSGVSIPLLNQDEIFGVLAIYTTKNRLFNEQEIKFLERISKTIISAVIKEKEQQRLSLLERAINSSINGIIITDASENNNPVIYVNSGFERITGYSQEAILGNNCKILQRNDQTQPEIEEIKQAIKEGKECNVVLRNYRKDGTLFWNQLHLAPVYNQDNILTNFIGIQTDITEEISTKIALKEKTRLLGKFTKYLKKINIISTKSYDNSEKLLLDYLKVGCQLLEMETGIISEIIGNNYIIRVSQSSQFDTLLPQTEIALENTFCEQVIKQEKTLSYRFISNTEELRQHPFYLNLNIESYVATPIRVNGEIYGTLSFFSTIPKENIFNYEKELIELIALAIGKLISTSEMELEKEQINVALQESQERLDSILYSVEDVIWSMHLDTLQLLYINPAAEELYQCNLAHFYQKRSFWLELVHPDDRQWVKECYSSLLNISLLSKNENNHDLEYRILLPNGEEKYVRDRAHIVYNQKGIPVRADGMITDVTKRRNAQNSLQKSEEQFRLTFELAPIGMIITSLDGYIEKVNQAICEILGYSSQELMGKNYAWFSHPDELISDNSLKQKLLTGEIKEYSKEKRYLNKNGNLVYTILKVTLLKDHQGKPTQFIKQVLDISERKKIEEQLLHDALHDRLTDLANRVLFMELLEKTLARCQRHREEVCAVLFLDLDQFKMINDSIGHSFGDELLKAIAQKIKACLRSCDTLARLGGDEFVILLDELKSQGEAVEIAERILNACRSPLMILGYEIFSSISIGITFSSFGYQKPEEMLRDADLTMYQSKSMGRNRYSIFDKKMHAKLLKRVQIESSLRQAIDNQELTLFYQPIVSLKTRKLAGFEALIRWIHPQEGFISPGEFIPIAEETGLIIPIGEWVLLEGAKQIVTWQNLFGDSPWTISVNLSGKQLIDQNLLKKIDHILETTKVNPHNLKLEVTETILMDNFEYAQKLLQEIQSRNLKISLDDFGTGYSSLSYLHRLPINSLKIDRSFVAPIETKPEKTAIVKAIITLAHNLSLDVIAEGIETEKQAEILNNIDCNYGQGYLFSKPVDSGKAELIIKEMIN